MGRVIGEVSHWRGESLAMSAACGCHVSYGAGCAEKEEPRAGCEAAAAAAVVVV